MCKLLRKNAKTLITLWKKTCRWSWVWLTLEIKPEKSNLLVILHITPSQIISAASYRSHITMVTQRVDILTAIKLRLNCSPVFLVGVPLQKALSSAPRLITQIRVSEGEMWCHLKMCLRGLNGGRRNTFQASQVNSFLPQFGSLPRATTNSWFRQREAT